MEISVARNGGHRLPRLNLTPTNSVRSTAGCLPEDAKSHWCEVKVGALMELEATSYTEDPCAEVPDKFLDLAKMEQVTREIKRAVPKGTPFERVATPSMTAPENATEDVVAAAREPVVADPPKVLFRDVTATLADGETFGQQLAAHAWSLGFAGAIKKAFIGDGGNTNWGIYDREFKHQGYLAILDFIHALTYVFAAAMAGRSREAGGVSDIRPTAKPDFRLPPVTSSRQSSRSINA